VGVGKREGVCVLWSGGDEKIVLYNMVWRVFPPPKLLLSNLYNVAI